MRDRTRKRPSYAGKMYFCFEMCENAIRATTINDLLNTGRKVVARTESGETVEIDEARPALPLPEALTIDDRWVQITGYNGSDEVQPRQEGGA